MTEFNIYGIQEFVEVLNKLGYKLSVRGAYYNTKCNNFTYTKKIDGTTYVFTDKDVKHAMEYNSKHGKPKGTKKP